MYITLLLRFLENVVLTNNSHNHKQLIKLKKHQNKNANHLFPFRYKFYKQVNVPTYSKCNDLRIVVTNTLTLTENFENLM